MGVLQFLKSDSFKIGPLEWTSLVDQCKFLQVNISPFLMLKQLLLLLLLLVEVVDSQVGLTPVDAVSATASAVAVRGRGGAAGGAERVGARSDVVLRQPGVHGAVAPRRLYVLQKSITHF